MTISMTITITPIPSFVNRAGDFWIVSKILGAMKLKIHEIVLKEQRPFSLSDLKEFEIGGNKYRMNYGTLRNNISALVKAGLVEPAFRLRPAFYTIPGKKFNRMMTLDHTGVPNAIINKYILKQTPVYKWIKNRPFEKQALHNIRLVFESTGIWNIFSIVYPDKIGDVNKDIELPTLIFLDHINVIITIHHNNTVSTAVSCSDKPVATDVKGIIRLFEVLTRTEVHITDIIDNYYYSTNSIGPRVTIPHYGSWVVKMWHFGIDSIDEYDGKEFHVTFEEGMSDLVRIYTKRIAEDNKNKQKVRVERQEYPNQEVADAFIRKYFRDGHLVDPDEGGQE